MKNWEIPNFKSYIFNKKNHKYCLVIPVINEGDRLKNELIKLSKIKKDFDVIIADGGSNDGSTDLILLKKMKVVDVILIKQDIGRLSAQLRMAYAYALKKGYQGIVTIDGNGKDDVQDIQKFIYKLDEGYDYIQGSRFIKGGKAINTPIIRYLGNRFIHAPLLSLFSHSYLTDTTNGFRGYSRRYLLDEKVAPFRKIFMNYELLFYLSLRAGQLGYKVIEVPVSRIYPSGKIPTKISFKGNFDILFSLFKVILGFCNPK